LLRHCCRFGNNFEQNFVISTISKQIEHVQFVSTLSKGRNFSINSFDIVAGNKLEQSRIFFDKIGRCFDVVAGVDGAERVAAAVDADEDVIYACNG